MHKTKTYIGVDIGLNGAITFLADDVIRTETMPVSKAGINISELDNLFWNYEGGNCILVMEKLGPIFGSSKSTAWSMGMQVGIMKTICEIRAIAYTEVSAKVWQKEMFQGISPITKSGKSSLDTKAMALESFRRLYPGMDFKLGKSKKDHDGCIDSLLIATYAKRKNL